MRRCAKIRKQDRQWKILRCDSGAPRMVKKLKLVNGKHLVRAAYAVSTAIFFRNGGQRGYRWCGGASWLTSQGWWTKTYRCAMNTWLQKTASLKANWRGG
jgi:hypothetical protein